MKKYKIEILLGNMPWSKSRIAKILKVWPGAIKNVFKKGNPRIGTQEKYTRAYNSVFKTCYTWQELFSKEEVWEQDQNTPIEK